ncbi:MAG: hypothetical protein AMXMBFR58_30470 [Phycisphaerae bacterium]|nr:hypothetical protein [Phycisphaerales bacterium]
MSGVVRTFGGRARLLALVALCGVAGLTYSAAAEPAGPRNSGGYKSPRGNGFSARPSQAAAPSGQFRSPAQVGPPASRTSFSTPSPAASRGFQRDQGSGPSRGSSWGGGGGGRGDRDGGHRGGDYRGNHGGYWGGGQKGDGDHTSVRVGINIGSGYGPGWYGSRYYGSGYYGSSYWRSCDSYSSFSWNIGSGYCPPPRVYYPPRVYCPPPVIVRPCPTYIVTSPVIYTEPVVVSQPVVAPPTVVVSQAAPTVIVRQPPVILSTPPATRLDEVQTTSMTDVGGAMVTTASTNAAPVAGGFTPTATIPAPAALGDPIPGDLAMSAIRSDSQTVVLTVTGSNPSANFKTDVGIEEHVSAVPVLRLRNMPTSAVTASASAQPVAVPFAINVSVRVPSSAGLLTVRVADREYQVPIVEARPLGH